MDQQETKPNLLKIKLTQTGTGPGTPVDEVWVYDGCVCFVCVGGWVGVGVRVRVRVGGCVMSPTQTPSSVDQQETKPNLLKIKLTQTGTGPGTPVDEVCVCVCMMCEFF